MKKITSIADLQGAIQELEHKQESELPLLKEEFRDIYEKLRPINLIKSTIKDAITAPDLKTNLMNTAMGVATGFLSKKLFLGQTHNPISKLIGSVMELVVSNKVAKNGDMIRSIGSILLKKIIPEKSEPEKEESDAGKI